MKKSNKVIKKTAKAFMGKNFLLDTDTAKLLYHNYAANLPIIDYHCHVPPQDIAKDVQYANITELWLGGDHYKWRAMRSCGVAEEFITGDGSDYDKFRAYCECMPKLIGNPLYHWSHLELKRYFGFKGILSGDTCDEAWALCNTKLASPDMSVRNIIKASGVEALCTTDDPIDSLEYHKQLAADDSFDVKVLPAFRPDKGINLERRGYTEYVKKLGEAASIDIEGFESLKDAYINRLDYFGELGCVTADHGIDEEIPYAPLRTSAQLDDIFRKVLCGGAPLTDDEIKAFKTAMLAFFAGEYKRRGWVMQIHFGVLRNVNPTMFENLGPDTGFDIIGGRTSTTELAKLLALFDTLGALPRTIIYSVNPTDNASVGALLGGFQTSGDGMPQVMQGSAWWFNDHLSGMREQMASLASLSALGCFPGMLTDSRSFISYTRHEYFRRILCGMLGEWVEKGLYPDDIEMLSGMVMDICYNNTKRLFKF